MSKQTSNNPSGFRKVILLLILLSTAALMIFPVSADTGGPAGTGSDGIVTIAKPVQVKYYIWEDTVTFSGTNTGSGTTYLFITGPNLKTNGAQIQSLHPGQSPVIDDDASTFQAAKVMPDNTWSYTWDTHNVMIDSGVYTVYAASTPRDLSHINSTHFDRISLIMVPPRSVVRPVDTDAPDGDDASAGTGVTISAIGDKSYYLGEKVVFSGHNEDSDTTYLFMTGPGTFMNGPGIPDSGGKLTSPLQKVVSGNPDSFTLVKTNPDKTWEYTWYTANLPLDAGTYTVYAASQPKAVDQPGPDAANVGIIVKKPFITAEVAPATISNGVPFTVYGVAEGIPPYVQVWILGKNYYSKSIESVNSSDASYKYEVPGEVTGKLAGGQYFVVVQHPMQNNTFDIDVSGDYVKLNNDTNLFKISGSGSLQGSDAADALTFAISDQETNDRASTAHDTYTIVPVQITGGASGASAGTGVTIAAYGDQSYYLGEKVVFSGHNYDSDTTYLFITGPGVFVTGPGIPDSGGKLTSPLQKVVSGNPDSFTAVKTKADKSWEYSFYTANLPLDAGTYSVYAASQPKAKDQLGPDAANVGIILKKPFITAEISPSSVLKGQPFTVNGTAEGNPPAVQIWIIGNNYVFNTTAPVNPDASFTFNGDAQLSGKLPEGQWYLIVQHSMQNNTFDIAASGDYVRTQLGNNILFRIKGAGSLQGRDAAEALTAALSDPRNGDDTFTEIPFSVEDTGISTPQAQPATTAPVQSTAQAALLPFALTGAFVLVLGIIVWKRH
jgi:hypothetical protein